MCCSASVCSTNTLLCYVLHQRAVHTLTQSATTTASSYTCAFHCFAVATINYVLSAATLTTAVYSAGKGFGEVTAPMLSRSYQRVLSGLWVTTSLNELSAKIPMWCACSDHCGQFANTLMSTNTGTCNNNNNTAMLLLQVAIYPLEIAKTRLAVSRTGEFKGIGDCITKTLKTGGIQGLYSQFAVLTDAVVNHRSHTALHADQCSTTQLFTTRHDTAVRRSQLTYAQFIP
eukprot:21204-Heterococcus_DN1.PRE.3